MTDSKTQTPSKAGTPGKAGGDRPESWVGLLADLIKYIVTGGWDVTAKLLFFFGGFFVLAVLVLATVATHILGSPWIPLAVVSGSTLTVGGVTAVRRRRRKDANGE